MGEILAATRKGLEEGLEKGRAEGREEGRAEGVEIGLEKGREEGREENKLAIARNLKSLNIEIGTIVQATGLTAEVIESL